jgi:hypothetical protein
LQPPIGLAVPFGSEGVSKAEDWESHSSRSGKLPRRGLLARMLQGSSRLVSVFGWHQAEVGTTKEWTGNTRHQQCPLLVEVMLSGRRVFVVVCEALGKGLRNWQRAESLGAKQKGECVSGSGQSMAGSALAEPPYFEEPLKKKLARRRRNLRRAVAGGQYAPLWCGAGMPEAHLL